MSGSGTAFWDAKPGVCQGPPQCTERCLHLDLFNDRGERVAVYRFDPGNVVFRQMTPKVFVACDVEDIDSWQVAEDGIGVIDLGAQE